jgi:predicted enzyme related to lactoylglutathione lyase
MRPSLNRIVLYAKDVQATCAFYERHFEFECEVARQPSSPVDLHRRSIHRKAHFRAQFHEVHEHRIDLIRHL